MTPPGVPERGDLVWVDFNPRAGHEQTARRPALVLSPAGYNRKTGLALMCPITSQVKGYPFEVQLPAGLAFSGVVLADHVKNLDWQARNVSCQGRVPDAILAEVFARLEPLIRP